MAFIHFDSRFAPCGFLILRDGHDLADLEQSTLVQTDWDYPAIASAMGWQPCHDGTDGTVKCDQCGKTASDLIGAAFDHIEAHEGESFAALDEYL